MKEVGYVARFEAQPDGGYTVTFPDVPGAISEGDDFASAWFNAREALELILEAHAEAGEGLPRPSELADVVDRNGEHMWALKKETRPPEQGVVRGFEGLEDRDGVRWQLVTAAVPTKAVRINVTMDEGLLERLNRRVDDLGQSRSAFIAEAVRKSLREDA